MLKRLKEGDLYYIRLKVKRDYCYIPLKRLVEFAYTLNTYLMLYAKLITFTLRRTELLDSTRNIDKQK